MNFIGLDPDRVRNELGNEFAFLNSEREEEARSFVFTSNSAKEYPGIILKYIEEGVPFGVRYRIRILFSTKDNKERDEEEILYYVEFDLKRIKAALKLSKELKSTEPKKRKEVAKEWIYDNRLSKIKRYKVDTET